MNDKNYSKQLMILTTIILVISLINLFNSFKLGQMKLDIIAIRNQTEQMQINLNSSINSGMEQLETALKKQNSILADFQFSADHLQKSNNGPTVDLTLRATPKTVTAGQKLSFIYTLDKQEAQTIAAIKGEATEYTAKVTIPLADIISIKVVLEAGSSQQTEEQEVWGGVLREKFIPKLDVAFSGSTRDKGGALQIDGSLDCFLDKSQEMLDLDTAPVCQIIINGQVQEEIAVSQQPDEFDAYYYVVELQKNINFKPQDSIELAITLKNSAGIDCRYPVLRFQTDENGKLLNREPYVFGKESTIFN